MPGGSRTDLADVVRKPMEHVTALLLPVFFISTGLSVNLGGLGIPGISQLAAIITVACGSKPTGAFAAARASGMSTRDSASIGPLMNARGLTELIFLNVGMSMGVLDGQMFTMMAVMALVTTGMAGPLISYGVLARDDGEAVMACTQRLSVTRVTDPTTRLKHPWDTPTRRMSCQYRGNTFCYRRALTGHNFELHITCK